MFDFNILLLTFFFIIFASIFYFIFSVEILRQMINDSDLLCLYDEKKLLEFFFSFLFSKEKKAKSCFTETVPYQNQWREKCAYETRENSLCIGMHSGILFKTFFRCVVPFKLNVFEWHERYGHQNEKRFRSYYLRETSNGNYFDETLLLRIKWNGSIHISFYPLLAHSVRCFSIYFHFSSFYFHSINEPNI